MFMRLLGLSTFCALAMVGPALAQTNVDFTGTVTATCALSLPSNGTLALNSTGDVLGSQVGLGTPGTVTVLSIGSNNLDIDDPVLFASPVAYNTTGQVLEVAYSGASGLAAVDQPYTSSDTSVAVGTIAASLLTVNNRITNTNGFAPGSYTTRTVITCGP
jgi:hypothetical protein